MSVARHTQIHYSIDRLAERVNAALQNAGLGDGPVAWSDLSRLDQFHMRGLPATLELAERLGAKESDKVIDIGSGLGGPARYLAATFGCRVTGIDLSEPFVAVANDLNERSGLEQRVDFLAGDATKLPFSDEEFNHGWTLHVGMNIDDKLGLYREVYRVLKPGGRFAIYDIVKRNDDPITFPVPWARSEAYSFVITPGRLTELTQAAGFNVLDSVDTTPLALDWITKVQNQAAPADGPSPLGLGVIIGDDAGEMLQNLARNIQSGKIGTHQLIVHKG